MSASLSFDRAEPVDAPSFLFFTLGTEKQPFDTFGANGKVSA